MTNSQNGWPVVGTDRITDRAVLGVEFPNGWLKGDVDTIFTYLIGRLHREVEPLDNGGCWGYFVKNIEGSQSISNHASGTAIDYNAPKHPMGVRNTYSAADRGRIRDILADLDGVVRWGGDYSGRPDDMHFEIDKGAAAVRAVAERIRGELDMDEARLRQILREEISKETNEVAGEVWNKAVTLPDGRELTYGTVIRWLDAANLDSRAKATAGEEETRRVVLERLAELAAMHDDADSGAGDPPSAE